MPTDPPVPAEDLRPDPHYVCGAAFCDDPACNTHRPASAELLRRGIDPGGFDLDGIVTPDERDERTADRLGVLIHGGNGAAAGLPTRRLLDDVALEAQRAYELHGDQLGLRDLHEFPRYLRPAHHAQHLGIPSATEARSRTDARAADGTVSWADVLIEEVAEAIEQAARKNPEELYTELIQVSATAMRWAAAVRARGAGATTITDGLAR